MNLQKHGCAHLKFLNKIHCLFSESYKHKYILWENPR